MIKKFIMAQGILLRPERISALHILGLMIIGMLLEMIGIGLVVPVVGLLLQDDLHLWYSTITRYIFFLKEFSTRELIIMAMIGLVGVFLIKNLFLAYLSAQQTNFVYSIQENLAQRLFGIYLRQPYTFHLQRNSAELVRNISGEVNIFASGVANILQLSTEILVTIGVTSLLLVVEPIGAILSLIIFGASGLIFNYFTRKKVSEWGRQRQIHDALKIKHLQQGLGGVKDVILMGREKEFLSSFILHNAKSTRVWRLQSTLQTYPRLMFEMLAVCGLAVVIFSMLIKENNFHHIIPILGLFSAAAFRLMPSINRIITAIQNLRYSFPVVDTLRDELAIKATCAQNSSENACLLFKKELCLEKVSYCYPGTKSLTVKGISFRIKKGEMIGIIGASGAGKSTLIDLILGLLKPSDGSIKVDGIAIQDSLRSWQDQIGYVPQSIYLTDDTLRNNIAFGIKENEINDIAIDNAIRASQLDSYVASLEFGLNTIVGERGIRLSGGQRQRIGIARALYHNPGLLVLDEATSALDYETERSFMQAIATLQKSKTIIIVAHRLSTVENCDRIIRLEAGRIDSIGPPHEILSFKTFTT